MPRGDVRRDTGADDAKRRLLLLGLDGDTDYLTAWVMVGVPTSPLDNVSSSSPVRLSAPGVRRRRPQIGLQGLDAEQSDEPRLVLLLEQDDVEDAEASAAAEEQLLADLHAVGISRLAEVIPSGEWSL